MAVPALGACVLTHLHLDERDRSVTLGLQTDVLPSPLPEGWPSGANSCEFFVVFREATDVRIHGWDARAARAVRISGTPAEGISVRIGGAGTGMEFRAASAALARVRGLRVADGC
ncbi:Imm50 family immunity protein [Streptomyces sp. LHD-70]|uniref:Imm50 family immunity protein n=1 Tax=Streptomyces sp. LHD-70 TaxID=3072140 RepID=UPI002810404B|nr:Imm50 family immunity protein [Streptomyces sp. LHD-70]MDQ8706299.1 Imm50 family immunity protein [Streptomyces sp. LHD-70]